MKKQAAQLKLTTALTLLLVDSKSHSKSCTPELKI